MTTATAFDLNVNCACWPIEPAKIIEKLPASVAAVLDQRHANLFAETGVFLASNDFQSIKQQIRAVELAAQQADFQSVTLQHPRSEGPLAQRPLRGLLMGYDFHIAQDGPKLIEINTNAGGAFLNLHMLSALGIDSAPCVSESSGLAPSIAARQLADSFIAEWRLAGRSGSPASIVIVDEKPAAEYLYSDMLLARELLRQHFESVYVTNLEALVFEDGKLWLREAGSRVLVDMVYNRLTDFLLEERPSLSLFKAWHANAAVVSPSPRQHALLANKANLQYLAESGRAPKSEQLLGLSGGDRAALAQLTTTVRVTVSNADTLWAQRRQLFFKPAAEYAGRAAYRGAKLTRSRWQSLIDNLAQRPYVAQTLIPPPQRRVAHNPEERVRRLKFDIRAYAYGGEPLLLAARIYEGQTTNFRTPGGGFAPVAVLPPS